MTTVDRAALEAERDFLLRSIEDLDAEVAAGDINEADHAALRDDYVARAAAVIRALETPVAVGVEVPTASRPRNRQRVIVTVAACLLVAFVAAFALTRSVGDRGSGDQLTGSLPASVNDQLVKAGDLLEKGDAIGAIKIYDAILKKNPKQPVALGYRGWLVRLAGLKTEGLGYVNRAIEADPSFPDAHFFKGMMLWEDENNPTAAVAELRLFLSNNPPAGMVALVQDALKRASEEAGIPTE